MKRFNSFDNVTQVLAKYSRSSPDPKRPYSLDTIKDFMQFLGNPQNTLKVIHVAGTSGKTSTTYYINALLHEKGYKVGMTVSPHIDTVAERAQIDSLPLSEDEYCKEMTIFLNLVRDSKQDISYFELLIGFAFWEFARKDVDYAIVEVGLGGLLDGTNIVDRSDKISVITDIGLDHTEILGDTLRKIAVQKAGIINSDSDVFIQQQSDDILSVVQQIATDNNALLHVVQPLPLDTALDALPPFQQRNLNLARAVCEFILQEELKSETLNYISQILIPGRMEKIYFHEKIVVLDGSHNQQKIAALVAGLKSAYPNKTIPALVSIGSNKQADNFNILKELRIVTDDIILTTFTIGQDEIRKSVDPELLKTTCQTIGYESIVIEADPKYAFDLLLRRNSETLLVTGSYFLLNHIRPIIFN